MRWKDQLSSSASCLEETASVCQLPAGKSRCRKAGRDSESRAQAAAAVAELARLSFAVHISAPGTSSSTKPLTHLHAVSLRCRPWGSHKFSHHGLQPRPFFRCPHRPASHLIVPPFHASSRSLHSCINLQTLTRQVRLVDAGHDAVPPPLQA